MTEKQYFNRLLDLTAKLARAASARPYDPDAYNSVIDELNKLSTMPIRLRRRRDWMMITIIVVLAIFLGLLVVKILDVIIF